MDPYALTDQAWTEEIGRRLEALRDNRKLSRDELGEEMGVSQPTLRNLLDKGKGSLTYLISALRALEAMDQLETFIQPPKINPAKLPNVKKFKASESAIIGSTATLEKVSKDEEDDLGW